MFELLIIILKGNWKVKELMKRGMEWKGVKQMNRMRERHGRKEPLIAKMAADICAKRLNEASRLMLIAWSVPNLISCRVIR